MEPTNQQPTQKTAPPLWTSITLLIILTFGLVALFGLIILLLINGAEQMGLPAPAHIAILVIISGVFAWLVKRASDAISNFSRLWFPEDTDQSD
jgi:hypothetical protein